jgi:hypothetical protein
MAAERAVIATATVTGEIVPATYLNTDATAANRFRIWFSHPWTMTNPSPTTPDISVDRMHVSDVVSWVRPARVARRSHCESGRILTQGGKQQAHADSAKIASRLNHLEVEKNLSAD